jgi:small subunit ribosomal protein S28e
MSRKGKGLKDVTETETEHVDEESFLALGKPAKVMELVGRIGVRGEATQVRCKILEGNRAGKVVRRNVKGPVRVGDLLMLKQTELEASPLTGKRR